MAKVIFFVVTLFNLVVGISAKTITTEAIFIDNVAIHLDDTTGKAIMKNGRTFVPIRVVSENLGYDVDWVGNLETVLITNDGLEVALKVGESYATVNGVKTPIDLRDGKPVDTKTFMQKGRTYVPIRFVGETFGCTVDYKNNNIYITRKKPVVSGYVPVTSVISNWNTWDEGRLAYRTKNANIEGEVTAYFGSFPIKYEHPLGTQIKSTIYDIAYMFDGEDFLNVKADCINVDMIYIKDGKVIGECSQLSASPTADGKYSIPLKAHGTPNREIFEQADQLGFVSTMSHNVAIIDRPATLRTVCFDME